MGNSSCQSCGEADCENAASSGPSSLPVESQKVLSSPPSINTWDFSSLSYDSTVLQGVAHELMTPAYGKSGGTQVELLRGFLRAVASGYQQNPFHNFAHAIDVLQALCWQSTQISGEHFLSSIQQFALTIAAIAVDLGHPGVDNAFLIDTGDPIASCYNDFSPLENMHCSQLFELLKKEALNVLGHLPAEDFREARRLIIDAILHTDRYRHLEVLNEVRAIARQGYTPKGAEHSSPEGLDILQALSRALLVFADVAHQARPLQTSNVWAKALEEELGLQNERERDLGLQVLPLNKWKPSRSDLQLHLAINRSGPLLGALLHIFPALHGAAETLAQNAKSWSSDCIAQEEVEGKPQTDGRLKKIDTLLDPSRAAPAPIDPKPGGNDRFGYLGAARPYTGRQQRLTSSTLASTLSSYSPQTSTTASTADRTSMMSNKPAPPLVREVRRWQEGKAAVVLGSKDIAESKSKNRELVLLYVLTDEGTKDAPVSYRWVDRNSTTVEDDIAADEVVARGQRAAQDDVYLESRKRRGSCVGPSPTVTARSADAVTTTVEPSRFDDVLTSLLHGNMVVPHQEHGGMSPAQHRRASRTSAVISDVSAATREGAAVAASVFGVLMRGR